jgi:peptidoglycan lytic transglycosylase G
LKKLIGFLFLLLVLAGAAAGIVYMRVNQPYRGYAGPEQFVEIPSGAGSVSIGDRLIDAGVIRDRSTYRTAVWMTGKGRQLKAGEYRFDRAMTPFEVIDKIARGDVYVVHVTFREGLTMAEMAKLFEAEGLGEAAAFIEAAKDPAPIREIDPAARDLEGYLFPETYALPRKADAAKLVRQMVAAFVHAFPPELREAAARDDLAPRQLVTLASIVEKETGKPEERPMIAAVYRNRLRIGMPLQCDPTVIYALERAGKFTGNLRRDDLMYDSPYNTYRYAGLPPGPIASPGKASLEAAARPAKVDYVYFVSRNDGSHEFARTLEEHNRNVQKYQIQYFRDKRLRERQESGDRGRSGR